MHGIRSKPPTKTCPATRCTFEGFQIFALLPFYGATTVARFSSQLRLQRWHGLQGTLAHVQSPVGTDVGAPGAALGAGCC